MRVSFSSTLHSLEKSKVIVLFACSCRQFCFSVLCFLCADAVCFLEMRVALISLATPSNQ
uniref:Uncharacterized protein n=1 Tax=Arundo donax TaxID=35708 RepID=A0A0A9H0S3_ARUDO